MLRKPLDGGASVWLSGRQYTIERVLGDGATCIVYFAYFSDHVGRRHRIILKECYPYNVEVERKEQRLIWGSETIKDREVNSFRTAYEMLVTIQNTQKLRNSTAHAFELVEGNGTYYSIVDVNDGRTFAEENCSLLDSLKTILALARVVGKYHDAGYLHLDIKASNFLTIEETRELVILFDVDSVTSMDDIRTARARRISVSEECAPPEQKQGFSTMPGHRYLFYWCSIVSENYGENCGCTRYGYVCGLG